MTAAVEFEEHHHMVKGFSTLQNVKERHSDILEPGKYYNLAIN